MQYTLDLVVLILLSCLGLVGWAGNVLGAPGNWLVVLLASGSYFLASTESTRYVGLTALGLIVGAACVGEILEFAASALGASRVGASKRGTVLSLGGSIVGAIVGLFMGNVIPIPILGAVIGSLLLGASGAFAGAVMGERWAGKQWQDSIEVGNAAFWGRLLGTVGKAVCGTVACGVYLIAIWQ